MTAAWPVAIPLGWCSRAWMALVAGLLVTSQVKQFSCFTPEFGWGAHVSVARECNPAFPLQGGSPDKRPTAHLRKPLMFDFRCRSTRSLAMASLLSLSLGLSVACDPNAQQQQAGETEVASPDTATPETPSAETPASNDQATSPDESAEVDAPTPEESGEATDPTNPAQTDDEILAELGSPTGPTPSEAPVQATATATAPLRSVASWETLFLNIWSSTHTNDWLPRSLSLDSYQFYNLGYAIDGNTAMYRATGKTQYMDRALLYVNNMVKNAKVSSSLSTSQYKDSYLGWTSQESGTKGKEVPLWESYCWRYVTRMLRVIRETPTLYNNPTYRSQYDRLLAFTERNIFEKWYKRSVNNNIYRGRTHMAAHWAYIALDLSRMTTDATKKATYTTVYNNINRKLPNYNSSMRAQLKPNPKNPAAYYWSAVWGSTALPGQDCPHGNGVLAYVAEAHDAGIEFTNDDMRKFVATLNTVVWPATGKYANYVDGSGPGGGWFSDGWMKLGRYDANLQRRLEVHNVGRTVQFYGNGALNARILLTGTTPP